MIEFLWKAKLAAIFCIALYACTIEGHEFEGARKFCASHGGVVKVVGGPNPTVFCFDGSKAYLDNEFFKSNGAQR